MLLVRLLRPWRTEQLQDIISAREPDYKEAILYRAYSHQTTPPDRQDGKGRRGAGVFKVGKEWPLSSLLLFFLRTKLLHYRNLFYDAILTHLGKNIVLILRATTKRE